MSFAGVYKSNRKSLSVTVGPGAIDLSHAIEGPVTLLRAHMSLDGTPEDEVAIIRLRDSTGQITALHTINPYEIGLTEITVAFLPGTWTIQNDGGFFELVFANTADNVINVNAVLDLV